MTKILRTLAFVIVLAGLMTWGMVGMAQTPNPVAVGDSVQILQGQAIENAVPADFSDVKRVDRR